MLDYYRKLQKSSKRLIKFIESGFSYLESHKRHVELLTDELSPANRDAPPNLELESLSQKDSDLVTHMWLMGLSDGPSVQVLKNQFENRQDNYRLIKKALRLVEDERG